jgi:hypothetical protein
MRRRIVHHLRYECAVCGKRTGTRYGFRMHMWAVHAYVSEGHALPGTGFGRRRNDYGTSPS